MNTQSHRVGSPPPLELPDDMWCKEPELCLWLMMSRDTFRRWRKRGLPCLGSGRLRRYHWPTLLEWLKVYDR